MRKPLECTDVQVKDLGDQPATRYVLVTALGAIGVDGWEVGEEGTVAFRRGRDAVALIPTHLTWAVLERGVLDLRSKGEVLDEIVAGVREAAKDLKVVVVEDEPPPAPTETLN